MSAITGGRTLRANPLRRLLVRPELGAVIGSVAVWIFFAIVAGNYGFLSILGTSSYLSVSAELAIQAVPVALLMIGGEFDLSVGSTVGATGMMIAILTAQYGWSVWAAIVAALIFAVLIGTLNGYLVLRTGLPSFIITLGTGYILLGSTTGLTSKLTGLTVVNGIDQAPGYSSAHAIFAAVIGGVLLTGGYGSAIGAMFGALAFGMVEEGIVFAGVDANWYKAVVGVILLLAVLLNSYVRKLALEARR